MRIHVILALCAGLLPGSVSGACQDIDPAACSLMMAANPSICTDPNIGPTACPRFCKLCPLECYHCNATVTDYHECNTTMQCPTGQVCMRKELSSYFDGHHEYEMTCQMKEVCDGSGLSFGFGRRDLSVSCCDTDLCNYPQPSTTTTTTTIMPTTTTHQGTGCHVDLVFVVDESRAMSLRERSIVTFLHNVVIRLPVSDDGVHVAVGTFSNTAQNRFDLTNHTTLQSVLAAVDAIHLNGGLLADMNAGLHYAIDHALTPAGGDRPNSDNVVVIITNHGTRDKQQLSDLETQLHAKSQNVIDIEIGSGSYQNLSTDRQHEFHLLDPLQLNQILSKVVSLICPQSL